VNGALVNKGDEAEIWNYAISVPSFEKITQLTLVQQQAFDLLGLHL
jgi:hypothetical protein